MFDSIILLLSVLPAFLPSYSIALVKCSMNSKREKYCLVHIKKAIDFSNIDEEDAFDEARKIYLSDKEASEIMSTIKESRVSLISDSSIGIDGCNYCLYFFDNEGSAKSYFSWWGNTPDQWKDLGKIVNALNEYIREK